MKGKLSSLFIILHLLSKESCFTLKSKSDHNSNTLLPYLSPLFVGSSSQPTLKRLTANPIPSMIPSLHKTSFQLVTHPFISISVSISMTTLFLYTYSLIFVVKSYNILHYAHPLIIPINASAIVNFV